MDTKLAHTPLSLTKRMSRQAKNIFCFVLFLVFNSAARHTVSPVGKMPHTEEIWLSAILAVQNHRARDQTQIILLSCVGIMGGSESLRRCQGDD